MYPIKPKNENITSSVARKSKLNQERLRLLEKTALLSRQPKDLLIRLLDNLDRPQAWV